MTAIQQKTISLIGLFFLSLLLWGQEEEWQKIGLEEGLPTTALNNMVQGPEGFWWISSEGAGLIRYDGYRFETFFNDEFPIIEKVERSWRNERLFWHDETRLAEFNGIELKVHVPQSGLKIKDLCDLDGSLYVASENALLFWNGDSLLHKGELPSGFVKLGTAAGFLFAETDSGLYRWQQGWLKAKEGLRIINGKAQGLWNGVAVISPKDNPQWWSEYPVLPHQAEVFAHGNRDASLIAQPDSLVYLFQNKQYLRPTYLDYPKGLTYEQIRNVYTLKRTAVLLTDQGLFLYQQNLQERIRTDKEVLSVYNEPIAGLRWGDADGLHFGTHPDADFNRTNGIVLALEQSGDTTFVATESGLYWTQGPSTALKSTPVKGFVFSLKSTTKRGLWAAASSGIWQLAKGEWALVRSSEEIDFASIFSISTDGDNLWFASYTNGVWSYDGALWTHYPRIAGIALDSIGISAMGQYQNLLAVGTLSDGIYLFNAEGNSYSHYSVEDLDYAEVRGFASSLPLEEPFDYPKERIDELWIATNKGLLSLVDVRESAKAGESGRVHFFGPPVSPGSLIQSSNSLISGGEEGLFLWRQRDWVLYQDSINLALLGLEILSNPEGETDEVLQLIPFSLGHQAKALNHDQNYLRFRFSARTLFYPELVQYRYRLSGQKEDWTYIGASREALFTDLKAGNYSLEVQARYPWSTWVLKSEALSFTIQEAIWRLWWFWTIIALLGLGLAFLYLKDRFQRQKERLKLENDLLEMERKALRLQMNPHFIFNALDSISSFIFKKDPKMAVRYLNNFAKLMRLTLESSMEHIHPVETEVSILKNYLELEKLRFSDKFDYSIEVDEELDYTIGLPPMLIQPHVENAILHGLKPKEGFGSLQISFQLDGEVLTCTIEDDGIGRAKARELPNKKAHRSMATQINRDRIDLLRASVDDLIELKIIDKFNQLGEACGTKVIIRLPAQEL